MRLSTSHRKSSVRALLVFILLAHAGLAGAQSDEDTKALQDQRALQAALTGFADKYMSVVAQAADEVAGSHADDIVARQIAHTYKLHSARAALEIATQPNPDTALLDMLVFASLQRMAMQDQWSLEAFGPQRQKFILAMLALEREIWEVAARYLDADSRSELRALIARWREKNSDTRYVFYVRFNDFAEARLESTLANRARSGGFLVDVSDVSRSADEAILLAERAAAIGNLHEVLAAAFFTMLIYRAAVRRMLPDADHQAG